MNKLIPALVAAIACLFLAAMPAHAADRVALVMGNGAYENADPLPNPPNDARAISGALRKVGFEVVEGVDLDRRGMERAIRDFLRKASAAKIALLFYAGHGMQVGGRNYLVPVDAALRDATDLSFETVQLDTILDNLNEPGRANIIVLDACRNNPLSRSFRARLGATRSASVGQGLAAYSTVGTGTLIAFATAPEQVALDGEGDNSPFTVALLNHLATPGLEVRQMLSRVRADVTTATANRQIPWDNSSLLGDVYLVSPPAAREPADSGGAELASKPGLDSDFLGQQRKALEEAAALREAAARELEKARQAARELEEVRRAARLAAEEVEKERTAALSLRKDPASVPQTQPQFAAVAVSDGTLSWGSGYNFTTRRSAEERALAECGKHAKDCKVVQWVKNACLALAVGKGGYGHAWADTVNSAKSQAVGYCRQHASDCKVEYSVCSPES